MNSQDSLLGIIDLCLTVEQKAHLLYDGMAARADDERLCLLWSQMARDEKGHLAYWQRLREMCVNGAAPEVFENPRDLEEFFLALLPKIDRLAEQVQADPSPVTALVLALRLEFYLLHPRFQTLFQCLHSLPGGPPPEEDYEYHLQRLLTVLADYGKGSPEVEFLVEMVVRIWEINQAAVRQAMTDHLTGVLNRRGLFVALKPLIYLARRHRHPVGVMMADIDNFKAVNDTFGHQAGDRVLAAVAQRLRGRLRASDILGRYGGEEFLLLLTPVDPEHLARIGEEIRRDVAEIADGQPPVTLSIGAAHSLLGENVEQELERLIGDADEALYEAKRAGKNRVVLRR